MDRVSKRSAAEAGDALLRAGRTQPALEYDVELGLERHQQWLQSDAPVPEWASAGTGAATKSLASVVIKTIVSGMVVGALVVAVWHARDRGQLTAAKVVPSSEPAPSLDVVAEEAELAPKPLPVPVSELVPDHAEDPARPTVRAEPHAKRAPRVHRAVRRGRETTAARARTVRDGSRASQAPEEVANAATTPAEVYVQPEPELAARPEPARKPQAPGDLAEMQQVATAEQLLERSPGRALSLVREGDRRFRDGYFQQERAYIAIMALIRLGRLEEARTRAASFAKRFPALPYGARIRSALEARNVSQDAAP